MRQDRCKLAFETSFPPGRLRACSQAVIKAVILHGSRAAAPAPEFLSSELPSPLWTAADVPGEANGLPLPLHLGTFDPPACQWERLPFDMCLDCLHKSLTRFSQKLPLPLSI